MTVEEIRSGIESRGTGKLDFLCYLFSWDRFVVLLAWNGHFKIMWLTFTSFKGLSFLDTSSPKFSKSRNYCCQMSLNPACTLYNLPDVVEPQNLIDYLLWHSIWNIDRLIDRASHRRQDQSLQWYSIFNHSIYWSPFKNHKGKKICGLDSPRDNPPIGLLWLKLITLTKQWYSFSALAPKPWCVRCVTLNLYSLPILQNLRGLTVLCWCELFDC